MTTRAKTSRATFALHFTKLTIALAKYVLSSIVLRGQTFTAASLAAVFQAALQADADLDAARSVVKTKLAARRAAYKTAVALLVPLHKYLEATYDAESAAFGDLGFSPPSPGTKSAAVKAKAAEQATATKKAKKAPANPPPPPAKPQA